MTATSHHVVATQRAVGDALATHLGDKVERRRALRTKVRREHAGLVATLCEQEPVEIWLGQREVQISIEHRLLPILDSTRQVRAPPPRSEV